MTRSQIPRTDPNEFEPGEGRMGRQCPNPQAGWWSGVIGCLSLMAAVGCTERDGIPSVLDIIEPAMVIRPDTYSGDHERQEALALFRPMSVRWGSQGLYVVDTGNDRVLLVDQSLRRVGLFGRAGSGPGELRGAREVDLRRGIVGVLDGGNSRINLYREDGRYLRAVRLTSRVFSFALLGDEHIVLPDETGEYAFNVTDLDGERQRLGARPSPSPDVPLAYPDGRTAMRGTGVDRVAVMGDTVVVADNLTGTIGLFSRTGRTYGTMSLPSPLLMRIFDRKRAADATLPVGTAFSPVYNDLVVLSDGRLLLLVHVDEVVGLIVDLEAGTVVRLETPLGAGGSGASVASSVAMKGDRLVFAGLNGISFYVVGRP